jgi:hypothetical protein
MGAIVFEANQFPDFDWKVRNIDALQRDLNPVVSDLLLHNMGFEVESVRWVPSPEEVKQHLQRPATDGVVTYLVTYKAAA